MKASPQHLLEGKGCKKCAGVELKTHGNLLSGYGCKECANKKRADKAGLTQEQFLAKMKEKGDPNVLIIGNYYSAKTEIRCRCKKCGNIWNATPNSLLQGHGCKECNGGSSKKVLCITTGEIFNSISDAKKKYDIKGTGITQCCLGKQHLCKGKEWKYFCEENRDED